MYKETIQEYFNRYVTKGKITHLIITERGGNEVVAKIDTEDRERVEAMGSWSVHQGREKCNYIKHTVHIGKIYLLHRYVTNAPDHKTVIFNSEDHNDCRKANLKLVPYEDFHTFIPLKENPHKYIYDRKDGLYGVQVYDLTTHRTRNIGTRRTLEEAHKFQDAYIAANPHCRIGVPRRQLVD